MTRPCDACPAPVKPLHLARSVDDERRSGDGSPDRAAGKDRARGQRHLQCGIGVGVILLDRQPSWAALALLVGVAGLGLGFLVGRTPPPALPRDTAETVRRAGLPVVPVTVLYLLLELACVLAVGWSFFVRITTG